MIYILKIKPGNLSCRFVTLKLKFLNHPNKKYAIFIRFLPYLKFFGQNFAYFRCENVEIRAATFTKLRLYDSLGKIKATKETLNFFVDFLFPYYINKNKFPSFQ